MQGNKLTYTFHIPGTLAANVTPLFVLEDGLTLLHLSAVGTNAHNATVALGTPDDAAAYLAATAVGASSVPAAYGRADFVGGHYPHLPAGTELLLTIDFDGNAGTAAQNVTIVLTAAEG